MRDYGFNEIENFQVAYKSRLKDYLKLMKDYVGHEVILMHLGGVIIECYLKYLIVKKYKVKKKRGYSWYTQTSANHINGIAGLKNSDINSRSDITNPKHNIKEAIELIEELRLIMESDKDLEGKITHLNNPLSIKDCSFIDLRYESDSSFSDIDTKFNKWEKDFREVLQWLIKQTDSIEV